MLKMYSFGELAAFVQSTAITAVGQRLFWMTHGYF